MLYLFFEQFFLEQPLNISTIFWLDNPKTFKEFRDLQIVSIFQFIVVLFTNIEIESVFTQFDLNIIIWDEWYVNNLYYEASYMDTYFQTLKTELLYWLLSKWPTEVLG